MLDFFLIPCHPLESEGEWGAHDCLKFSFGTSVGFACDPMVNSPL